MIFLSIFSTLHFHNRTIRASLRIDPPPRPTISYPPFQISRVFPAGPRHPRNKGSRRDHPNILPVLRLSKRTATETLKSRWRNRPSRGYILSPGRRAYAVHTTLLTSAHTYVSHQHAYNIRVINVWLPAFLSVSPLSHPYPVGDKVFESSSSWKRLSNFSHLTLFFFFSRFRAFLLLFASATTSLSPSWRDHVWLLNLRRDRFSGIVAIRHEVSAFLFFMDGMRC